MSLLDRIDTAIAYGVGAGKITSQSDWCIKADGVTDRYLSNFRVRARQSANATIGADILQALAKVIDVNWVWLASGEGEMLADGDTAAVHARAPLSRSEPAPQSENQVADLFENELLELPDVGFKRAAKAFTKSGKTDRIARDAIMRVYQTAYSGAEKLDEHGWLAAIEDAYRAGRKMRGVLGHGARELVDE